MATRRFRPGVAATNDRWTFTVATFSSGTVIGVTCNGKTISRTCGSGETATTAAQALQLLLAASTVGEFAEYLWTTSSGVITATAKIAGVPGTFTAAGTSSAVTASNATAATGPQFGSVAANWGGAVPADDDVLIFDSASPSLLYGLSILDGIDNLTIILDNFGGSIGLPASVANSTSFAPGSGAAYAQYRPRFLLLNTGTVNITIGQGTVLPTRVNLQFADTADATINVYGAGAPAAGEEATIYIHGTTGHAALNVTQGAVAVAYEYGQTGGFDVVRIGSETNPNADAIVYFGSGATVPSVVNQSGRSVSAANVTALVMQERAVSHRQIAGTVGATCNGGTLHHDSTGNLTVAASGTRTRVDFSGDPRPKAFSGSCSFTNGAALNDPAGTWATGTVTFAASSLAASTMGQDSSIARS